jgi:hypothetical protein
MGLINILWCGLRVNSYAAVKEISTSSSEFDILLSNARISISIPLCELIQRSLATEKRKRK